MVSFTGDQLGVVGGLRLLRFESLGVEGFTKYVLCSMRDRCLCGVHAVVEFLFKDTMANFSYCETAIACHMTNLQANLAYSQNLGLRAELWSSSDCACRNLATNIPATPSALCPISKLFTSLLPTQQDSRDDALRN